VSIPYTLVRRVYLDPARR